MDVQWRHLTPDDVPAWNTLMANAEQVDKTGEHYNEEDLREELDDPAAGPDDRFGGFVGTEMAVMAGVRPRADATEFLRIDGEGFVDPRWRGQDLGTQGVRWILKRAAQLHSERAPGVEARVQLLGYPSNNPAQIALFESEGFTPVNWAATMRAQLDDGRSLPEPLLPPGFTLHPYEATWSQRMREAHNALLRYALRAYREAGYHESSLDVDTNNPTGAFELYERAGYQVETRATFYQRVLPALSDTQA